MSNPPRYTRIHDIESRTSLKLDPDLHEDDNLLQEQGRQHDTYPPAGPSGGGGSKPITTYTFVPRWPIRGDLAHALGVLGKTQTETAEIVQRAFPTLLELPLDRIEFLALVPNTEATWGKVMEEAWEGFVHNPPAALRVQVIDGPGDKEARSRRDGKHALIVVGCLIGLGVTITLLIHFFG